MPPQARPRPRAVGRPLPQERQFGTLRYSPDGRYLVAGDFEGGICRWRVEENALTPLADLSGHRGWVQSLVFHRDGRFFSADSWGRLCCWASADAARPTIDRPSAHAAWVRRLALSPDGALLASCSADGMVRLWSADRCEMRAEWELGQDALALAFAPDGRSVLTGDLLGTIRRHDLGGQVTQTYDAAEMHKLDRIQDVGGVRCLAFSPDGTTLAAGGCVPTTGGFVQGTPVLVLYEAATGKRTQTLRIGGTNDGYILDMHYHPDGYLLAVTSGQPGSGKLLLHQPGEPQPFFSAAMPNCHALALRPDGRRVIVSATNANSAGNGRPLAGGNYPANSSPLHIWDLSA